MPSVEKLHTFGLAAHVREVRMIRTLADLERWGEARSRAPMPEVILGRGSNTIFLADYPGRVVRIALPGWQLIEESQSARLLVAQAGECWAEFVAALVARGWGGLENLTAIPGSVGAAPVQNIGAYGLEVAERIAWVRLWNRATGAWVEWSGAQLAFGYRTSVFKKEPLNDWVIVAVAFALPKKEPFRLDYPGVRAWLAVHEPCFATLSYPEALQAVARAIAAVRRAKLPDPAHMGNAGSFFLNPIVPLAQAQELKERFPAISFWPLDAQKAKISAASLIEAAGLKGARVGQAAVSKQHALVLVNLGGATGSELAALIRWVRDAVGEQFGVALEVEPVLIGAERFGLRAAPR